MSKHLKVAALLLAATAPLCTPVPAASTPVEVAANRCNSQTIDDASQHVRDYDRHSPGGNMPQLLARYGAIADVLAMLNEEREILSGVCSTDVQRQALFVQIAATTAWALALEADIAGRLNASCPVAAAALPTMMLSDAWLSLANVVNEDGGAVPPAFNDVIPKIQSRAAVVNLTLPAWSNTSAYWRDQVHAKAKTAMASCPSPSPSPTP